MNGKPRVSAVSFKAMDAPELFDMLNSYRAGKKITWTRFWLLGAAYMIDRDGDNPDLVVEIANYLSVKRIGGRKKNES